MPDHGTPPPTATAGRPDQIGPYRVLDELGEGAMGTVYLAEQHEPVRRRVAIKVIKLGMDTKEVLKRFELERQALAVMAHDSIAKVHDAGTTDRGQPWFAMEYVKGIPLTDYCDRNDLARQDDATLRARAMAALPMLAVLVLRQRRYRNAAEATDALLGWFDLVREVYAAPSGHGTMDAIMTYLAQTRRLDVPRLSVEISKAQRPDAENLMKTTADVWQQQGHKQGQAGLLLRLLQHRFGPLLPATVTRVRRASTRNLERWAEAVLTARSLDEVFAPKP